MKEIVLKKGKNKFRIKLLTNKDDYLLVIRKKLGIKKNVMEDLLEEQRPNTLNFKDYSLVSMSFPTGETLKTGSNLLQINFIIKTNELIIITNKESKRVNNAFSKLTTIEFSGVTNALSYIIDSVREQTIDMLEEVDEYLDKKEKDIVRSKINKSLLIEMYDLKERMYYIYKTVKGNLEVVRELYDGRVKFVKNKYFSEHHEDRSLYMLDLINYLREAISNKIETYLSLMSHNVNEQMYKLTVLGSILLIPTLISGFFGMNVVLPSLGFWELIGISSLLSFLTYLLIKK